MPFRTEAFSAIICVGSVLNYCDPARCLQEISRVLRPGGFAIIEYERSASADFILQDGYGTGAARFETFFSQEKTELWCYSDRFIDNLLVNNGLIECKSLKFHCLSPWILLLTGSPAIAAGWIRLDKIFSLIPFVCRFASNRMLMVKKISGQSDNPLKCFQSASAAKSC
jgi:SAM-dependent methyltransferase